MEKHGVLCTEMECAALYMNARAGKESSGYSDDFRSYFKKEALSAQERQTSFSKMMEIA